MNALAGSVPSSGSVPVPLYVITSPARKCTPSEGDRIVAVGTLPALIAIGVESELFTPSDTVSRKSYGASGSPAARRSNARSIVAKYSGMGASTATS